MNNKKGFIIWKKTNDKKNINIKHLKKINKK